MDVGRLTSDEITPTPAADAAQRAYFELIKRYPLLLAHTGSVCVLAGEHGIAVIVYHAGQQLTEHVEAPGMMQAFDALMHLAPWDELSWPTWLVRAV